MADYKKLIEQFHATWDNFPGAAALIDKSSVVVAVNKSGEKRGLSVGCVCSESAADSHRNCLKALTLNTREAHVDRPDDDKIRGWYTVDDYPDIVVHFTLALPGVNTHS